MSYVDWSTAKSLGKRLSGDGPTVSITEAADVVSQLRDAAARAHEPVAATARLDTTGRSEAPVVVVDRKTWIEVNIDSFEALTDPVLGQLLGKRKSGAAARAITAKISAAEAGAMLGFVSSKVLGQYDIAPGGNPSLLLVAPNIVAAERELGVNPHDFRLWVCLHEETHRVQFTAVPWLRDHVIDQARALMTDLVPDPEQMPQKLQEIASRLPEVLRGGGNGLADLITTPAQREQMAAMTAVMSLLEGHADVVMDDVGPQVVPSVDQIRSKFTERRKGAGGVDRLLRRLLGLEAKMRQYRDGALFCRAVTDQVGVDGFNAVWTSPETLPTALEITEPRRWVERVHG
ncbi:zinc-dependent metalloprotease [Calidifontibacter terrae]